MIGTERLHFLRGTEEKNVYHYVNVIEEKKKRNNKLKDIRTHTYNVRIYVTYVYAYAYVFKRKYTFLYDVIETKTISKSRGQ